VSRCCRKEHTQVSEEEKLQRWNKASSPLTDCTTPTHSLRCRLIIIITFSFIFFVFPPSLLNPRYFVFHPPLCLTPPLLSHPFLFTVTLTAVDAVISHVEATLLGAHLPRRKCPPSPAVWDDCSTLGLREHGEMTNK